MQFSSFFFFFFLPLERTVHLSFHARKAWGKTVVNRGSFLKSVVFHNSGAKSVEAFYEVDLTADKSAWFEGLGDFFCELKNI